ncbi:MAG: UDP-glucose/GDP-mannose dehydrogenase family protein [Chlorobium sp.]|jgi:UDPglucose 6-dehydrogenase|uniref:UDP-glucose dehydrogenase family protein n=1 Tax=Chlorobium sp. TaxID=1095 RepID=UPI0025B9D628|nr:UDP-glucose/GDP-mannose dehydrogenase family protein [Chlorobium sp.]MCF8216231.1 UDP-glucose/GDP-mannose dehydrogenase family protein [Chlorobium sp.]MCF8271133.1 UDP-glucose/GDP-mannose dehydrogenase family protein [Chlorobium sp.]MCF8287507.1 UDP-glucose/GDP-mannose dehydrogenase family protein [Chlorobium sp.]MCF8291046.1 UDP-glucose/GDP-mannose dehydrogenase family protein [Chlorobium sp.]MCF8385141.1 UDP-glucose/GDP-mannose dehydrogenase family protein [Chlorobium sp.]
MKITIFGSGYVGLVTGACFAEVGNDVLCVDIDQSKIERLNKGEIPIYEPGLEAIVHENCRKGRLTFTSDIRAGVEFGLYQFIAVGTPPDEDGSADLRHVLSVAESIGTHMQEYRIIINKSTVPVGTADLVREKVLSVLKERSAGIDFDVVSNPEFLKEGDAVNDFMKPERIVVGVDNPRTKELLRFLYSPFNRSHERFIAMDVRSAELTKYAANSMLATKISFMNEIANIAERVGADVEEVRRGIGSDSRIGFSFIYPGVGYGGSCFPKDVQALERTARKHGYDSRILQAVESVNNDQKSSLVRKMKEHFNGDLKGKVIALWGLAFKPNTDDMREAPSRRVMEELWNEGASVRVYDPVAIEEAMRIYGERENLHYAANADEAVIGADALAIITEWLMFRSPDFDMIKRELREPLIFDGRNIYNPEFMEQSGFIYYSIGRRTRGMN